eukprot:GHVT01096481.1.p1 GENE.GHVT01096481.1~~GHVT01096481.1.p1  ORF type:complete len:363 (+),score=61.71 GHVT01096481.1:415-1503(+)
MRQSYRFSSCVSAAPCFASPFGLKLPTMAVGPSAPPLLGGRLGAREKWSLCVRLHVRIASHCRLFAGGLIRQFLGLCLAAALAVPLLLLRRLLLASLRVEQEAGGKPRRRAVGVACGGGDCFGLRPIGGRWLFLGLGVAATLLFPELVGAHKSLAVPPYLGPSGICPVWYNERPTMPMQSAHLLRVAVNAALCHIAASAKLDALCQTYGHPVAPVMCNHEDIPGDFPPEGTPMRNNSHELAGLEAATRKNRQAPAAVSVPGISSIASGRSPSENLLGDLPRGEMPSHGDGRRRAPSDAASKQTACTASGFDEEAHRWGEACRYPSIDHLPDGVRPKYSRRTLSRRHCGRRIALLLVVAKAKK